MIGRHGRISAGARVAAILSGAWREPVERWTGPADDLAAVAPLLLHGGVAALAWRRLRGSDHHLGAPAAALQQAYRLQVLRAAVHEQEVSRSFTLLRVCGVEPVLGKGWAAARLYPDPGLRPYGDVDLYVRAEQHRAAGAAAMAPGADCPIDLHAGFAELDDRTPEQIEVRTVHAEANGCRGAHLRGRGSPAPSLPARAPARPAPAAVALRRRRRPRRALGHVRLGPAPVGRSDAHTLDHHRDRTGAAACWAPGSTARPSRSGRGASRGGWSRRCCGSGDRRGRPRAPANRWRTPSVIRGRCCERFECVGRTRSRPPWVWAAPSAPGRACPTRSRSARADPRGSPPAVFDFPAESAHV